MIPDKAPGEDVLHASGDFKKEAHIPSFEKYKELYIKSVESPEEFWGDVAKDFFWKTKYTGKFLDYNFDVTKGEIFVKCMEGATTNICYNVLDRNVHERKLGDKVAFYWLVFEKHVETWIFGHEPAWFRSLPGVKKGDRVSIYMPMVVELVVAMLACARIGAVHSIVFAGFSAESLCERIMDSQCCILITADGFYRGDKQINLKLIADEALQKCRDKSFTVEKCIVLKHLTKEDEAPPGSLSPPAKRACPDLQVPWNPEVDMCWHSLIGGESEECEPVWCDSEDPLFILYTSGSTGKPKGVLHTVSGYMLYTAATFKMVFDYHSDDVYWCTADIGWITAPTAIRLLMKYGSEPVQKYKRTSLKILGTVGEPINPEAWQWYYSVVGEKRCPVVDTFWQTETVFKQPWPGVMRTVYGNHERFETTYFKKFPGFYVTGDGCRRDKDGYYWITGRIDDMLNVSGHLLSTAEVESALVEHEAVAEAAVVGRPHPVKGESLYCFVTLNDGIIYNQKLESELKKQVREKIGAIATPDYIQNAPSLPKTRSGKIMRRVLRKIACNERDLGDVSTLADSSVIEQLFESRCCTAV
ncbi:Acetyl-coenzyme A synthetase, cytoplasmic [Labeo rohita]|uniref:Propionate--CoA ligase n=1 Tax=Labeo rohita TaxID=84645 RepID=A0ABQ8LGS5_LABRO|nr:Acetyl-coenzyme A synthetase, cytoplasmic [Labeo rohita]